MCTEWNMAQCIAQTRHKIIDLVSAQERQQLSGVRTAQLCQEPSPLVERCRIECIVENRRTQVFITLPQLQAYITAAFFHPHFSAEFYFQVILCSVLQIDLCRNGIFLPGIIGF
ncbi:hypothetical protein D3C86_1181730 [compost metagenome]